jgi:CRP/FNR family transcriptional regulator, cyclic AMP receptor protein
VTEEGALVDFAELMTQAAASIRGAFSSPTEIVATVSGLTAGALIVVSSFVRTMIPLRWLAVASNLGFVVFGALHPSLPMLLLHVTLLPINIFRAREMVRLTMRVRAATKSSDLSGIWLRPYMKTRALKKGAVLFRKGDLADQLYFLAEGRMEFVEIGSIMEPGRIFGEIAFFAPDRRRTLTARCAERCKVLTIDQHTLEQLYFQNPAFGFRLVGLVAGRLLADVQRLEQRLAGPATA